jgi:tight adherence protein B
MSAHLSASLAFAAAAALTTAQFSGRLKERRAEHRMRQIVGVVPLAVDTQRRFTLTPPAHFFKRRNRRQNERLSSQLAPALELIVGHLRIGRNVGAALVEVTDTVDEPLRSVFVEAAEEARLGTPLSDSLQKHAARTGNRHLGIMASAIGLQARHGGSLIEVLEAVHSTIEEEDRLQRDIRTLTADNRLSARVLLALPPIVLAVVSLLNPGYAAPLITEPLGQKMSAAGIVLALIGWRWLRHLANPEVVA